MAERRKSVMRLVFMVTARCNAACSHCSTSCGPHRTEALSRGTLLQLIDEAAELAGTQTLEISITGGEPFLDFALLRDVIAHGTRRGAQMTCVTNGYWATSPERAQTLLRELKDAGLLLVAISTSRFHQQFVKQQRVERALAAARRIKLDTELKLVLSASELVQKRKLVAWAKAAGAGRVQVIPLMPALREGMALPEQEFARKPSLPRGRCPAALINVSESGEVYPCCTPGAINRQFFSLGNVADSTLAEIRDRFNLAGRQQILREHGPAWFAREIQARGLGGRLRNAYGSVCDLCTHIGSDPDLAAAAEAAATQFEYQQLEAILHRATEGTFAAA